MFRELWGAELGVSLENTAVAVGKAEVRGQQRQSMRVKRGPPPPPRSSREGISLLGVPFFSEVLTLRRTARLDPGPGDQVFTLQFKSHEGW